MKRGRKALPRRCIYFDDRFERREGEIVERNGNLTLVRDAETGKEDWLAPHDIERGL